MPAGDLIEADYQGELRGRLFGAGTRFDNGPEGWGGLGLPAFKTSDVDLDQADGVYPGRDYLAARVLTFPLVIGGHGPAEAFLDLADLELLFLPSDVDLELHLRLPGWGKFHVLGRPRGLDVELAHAPKGEISALATFLASDPTVTYDEVPGS